MTKRNSIFCLSVLSATLLCGAAVAAETGTRTNGNVYALSNQPDGNEVLIYHRNFTGRLNFVSRVATGGNGAGSGTDPLQSQNPVVLSEGGKFLFAVNAGSNSVSAFRAFGNKLVASNTVSSGGIMPVSLTVRKNLLYVLNAKGTPNISGFTIDKDTGNLSPLAESTQALPGGAAAAPAQVSFVPGQTALAVTEKDTSQIDTFPLDTKGVARMGTAFPSGKPTPFGFAFAGPSQVALVSDAAGGKPMKSALSAYKIDSDGALSVVDSGEANMQTAACWVAVTDDGAYAYVVNLGSGNISSYRISVGGDPTLLSPTAGGGNVPADAAFSKGSQYLYVRNGGDGTISQFRRLADGGLRLVDVTKGLPVGAAGLAAR
ncbi:MAG: beta-propeller fold lactonase family protein [Alphaproteobacteria bacterium]|nr:beta-propeller fold lactonase family protein [Alphaproteobacteria bacterium]